MHRDAHLLNDAYPEKFRVDLERRVRAFGIDLILNDAVGAAPGVASGVTTQGGKALPDADLIVCFPPRLCPRDSN